MRLCRFDDDRLGVVRGDQVHDVTNVLDALPALRWPLPLGDQLIANLPQLREKLEQAAGNAPRRSLSGVRLKSPVANPSKIMGAPVNYRDHLDEANKDPTLAHGRQMTDISNYGLFLKANTALVGPGEGVALRFTDRRNDHEVELAAIIGRKVDKPLKREEALSCLAGYSIGLDMTVRGPEFQSWRKSIDSYAVLGPWLVTAEEIVNPNNLDLELTVNGEPRQKSSTRYLVYDVEKLIVWASTMYTLHPGDIIMTGTPAGVGPVRPGDTMNVSVQGVGDMAVKIRAF